MTRSARTTLQIYAPADLQSVEEASWVTQTSEFPFAEDGLGNYYTVGFQADVTAPSPVLLHWHDGGDVELLATSLDDFLRRTRPPDILSDAAARHQWSVQHRVELRDFHTRP